MKAPIKVIQDAGTINTAAGIQIDAKASGPQMPSAPTRSGQAARSANSRGRYRQNAIPPQANTLTRSNR